MYVKCQQSIEQAARIPSVIDTSIALQEDRLTRWISTKVQYQKQRKYNAEGVFVIGARRIKFVPTSAPDLDANLWIFGKKMQEFDNFYNKDHNDQTIFLSDHRSISEPNRRRPEKSNATSSRKTPFPYNVKVGGELMQLIVCPPLENLGYSAKEDNKTYWMRPCSLPVASDACPVGAVVCVFNHTGGLDKAVEPPDEHSSRMTAVHLKCNESVPLVPLLHDLLITRPNLCMVADDVPDETSHLSTGSVLVIMFIVFSSLYFVGGALALKLLRGAEGREMIPNYDFWVSLPGLVKEGFLFTINGCQTPQAYDRI
ncbi:uncharacterized protein [Anabrus simplex]|uniref:uncharacterized protein n=1 Tax=Anabrus simplex TaxID=316456 RepID=UPI0035A3B0D6